jgi:D-alanyl-D-alanine carboxypeptidase
MACATVAGTPESSATREPGPTQLALADATPTPTPVPTTTPVPALTATPTAPPPAPTTTVSPPVVPSPSGSPLAAVAPAKATAQPSVPAPSPTSPPAGPVLDERTAAKLQKILDNQVGNKEVAGLQAAVRLPSGELWVGTAGKAEFSPARPIRADTQFAIASITKTFVAALILQLVDEGKVDLDATFGTYFRDAPRKDTVTVRQLLSHTSGIYNFWANPRYGRISRAWWEKPNANGLRSRAHRWTYEEMMDLVRSGEFKPGTDYQYSNTNYLILRRVAEAVEDKPLPRQLRQRFFEPLGLEDSVYQPAQEPRADAAHGHWNWGGGYTDHTGDSAYVPFMAAASIADAAGAMASTAGDLATWASALYGGDVLSPEMREEMTTILRPGLYGLGTDVAVFAGHRGYGHRGGIRGYESSMWYFPESGVSVVLLSNQGNWLTDQPMEKLVKTVLGSR